MPSKLVQIPIIKTKDYFQSSKYLRRKYISRIWAQFDVMQIVKNLTERFHEKYKNSGLGLGSTWFGPF